MSAEQFHVNEIWKAAENNGFPKCVWKNDNNAIRINFFTQFHKNLGNCRASVREYAFCTNLLSSVYAMR